MDGHRIRGRLVHAGDSRIAMGTWKRRGRICNRAVRFARGAGPIVLRVRADARGCCDCDPPGLTVALRVEGDADRHRHAPRGGRASSAPTVSPTAATTATLSLAIDLKAVSSKDALRELSFPVGLGQAAPRPNAGARITGTSRSLSRPRWAMGSARASCGETTGSLRSTSRR